MARMNSDVVLVLTIISVMALIILTIILVSNHRPALPQQTTGQSMQSTQQPSETLDQCYADVHQQYDLGVTSSIGLDIEDRKLAECGQQYGSN